MSAIHPEWILFGGILIGALVLFGTMLGLVRWKKLAFVATTFVFIVGLVGMTFSSLQSHKYDKSRRNACLNNLKLIQQAKQRWAGEHPEISREPSQTDLFGTDDYVNCPGGGVYSFGRIDDRPKCSLEKDGHKLD